MDKSTNIVFLDSLLEIQSMMENNLVDLGHSRITYNSTDQAPYWNYALANNVLLASQISEIETRMRAVGRDPAIYFEDRPSLSPLKEALVKRGYGKSFEDSWLFWDNLNKIDESKFSSVKKVKNPKELAVFLSTFDSCYQVDDPQNPYGTLGYYLNRAKTCWEKYNESGKVEYFTAYTDGKPTAVATLTHQNGFGYISNVGSLRQVRGQGFGKAITLYCVRQSILRSNREHFIGTEEGTYPNEFYKRIGFRPRFRAVCYSTHR